MNQPIISLTLIALTLAAFGAWVAALRRLDMTSVKRNFRTSSLPRKQESSTADDKGTGLRGNDETEATADTHLTAGRVQQVFVAAIAGVTAGLFAYRWLIVHGRWQPLAAHLDGLLLMSVLFAAVILLIQSRPRLFGLSAFALPMLALILAWAVCAAAWTYKPFQLDTLHPVWQGLHLTSVYLGTLGAIVAAIAGGMYLFVQHRLKRKPVLAEGGPPLASLETLETVIIRTATLGFVLLTLGMASGLVIIIESPEATNPGWWHTPKVLFAIAAWAVFAVVMNVKHSTRFRGARAAWLSIVGLVLLLTVYGIVTTLPEQVPIELSPGGNSPTAAKSRWGSFDTLAPRLHSGGLVTKEASPCAS